MPSLRVPISWLRDYLDLRVSPDEVAERLHMAGIEVDHVERTGAWGDKVHVARIEALVKHPNADKLQLATVDYGNGRKTRVVTGAFNISVGDVVPYAETGAELIDGHTGERTVLKPRPMRGIVSEGMVLSAKELGLGDDHEGILLLDKTLRVGAALRDVLGETIIQFEIAPNRPDALSVVGIAREASAILATPLRPPAMEPLAYRLDPALLTVSIEDPEACPRFAAAYLTDVRIGESPAWMQQRLRAAGMRPIDAVVDITNYVMLELGQPLHAYDATMLRGGLLVARKAKPGERLRTLDGIDRALRPADLVIADADRALGLAGIMGGADSEIREATSTVALECASFEPLGIRRAADAHGLQGSSGSAAARRFGLDLSPALVPLALARAVRLMREHASARLVGATDVYPTKREQRTVRMRVADVARVLGAEIAPEESEDALQRLGFSTRRQDGVIEAIAPTMRTDIGIPEDLVEEVARIVGYDRIPTRLPTGPLAAHERHPLEELRERARDALVGFGLQETVSYAGIDPAWLSRLTADGSPLAPEPLRIVNPTSVALSVMRPTLRASLLDTAQRNLGHRSGVALFEIANVYLPRPGQLPDERWTIGIVLAGAAEPVREGETWLQNERPFDLHDLRGVVAALREALRLGASAASVPGAPGLHPGRSERVETGARIAYAVGQLDPRVAARWDLPEATFIAELDLATMLGEVRERASATAPPRYPAAIRDLALVLDDATPYGEVERAIRAAGKDLVESVALLDLYHGPQAGPGKKSVAVRLVLRSASGTLTDADVDRAMKRIEGRLLHQLGATPRA